MVNNKNIKLPITSFTIISSYVSPFRDYTTTGYGEVICFTALYYQERAMETTNYLKIPQPKLKQSKSQIQVKCITTSIFTST
jgi:hypothetical protein